MALSKDFEDKCKWMVEGYVQMNRPAEDLRDKVDLGWRLENQSVYIFEIRPSFKNTSIKQEEEVAKATYAKSKDVWKIYWMRADLKWHVYDPNPEVESLAEFLKEVNEDPFCCFFG